MTALPRIALQLVGAIQRACAAEAAHVRSSRWVGPQGLQALYQRATASVRSGEHTVAEMRAIINNVIPQFDQPLPGEGEEGSSQMDTSIDGSSGVPVGEKPYPVTYESLHMYIFG